MGFVCAALETKEETLKQFSRGAETVMFAEVFHIKYLFIIYRSYSIFFSSEFYQ